MDCRLILIALVICLSGCANGNDIHPKDSQTIRVGNHANLHDLARAVGNWDLILEAIREGDNRNCVRNLTLDSMLLFDLEPIDRLSLYNPQYAEKTASTGSVKIYRLGFSDPCDEPSRGATNPHWIVAEYEGKFELVNFIQVME